MYIIVYNACWMLIYWFASNAENAYNEFSVSQQRIGQLAQEQNKTKMGIFSSKQTWSKIWCK